MRIRAGMLLLGAMLLSGCDTPQPAADGAPAKPKTSSAERYTTTGSRIATKGDQPPPAQPDMQTVGGDGYSDSVRGKSGGLNGGFPH